MAGEFDERTYAGTSFSLDALEVGSRFRLFHFAEREDGQVYLWILRALDRLRAEYAAQAHEDDVAEALAFLAASFDDAPNPVYRLRDRLDNLALDGVLHRLEDATRAGSLARYRNRQSVYQFSDLGYFAYTAVESVLGARFEDANLSRLVFSDLLQDLNRLGDANRHGDGDEIVRRLASLDRAVEDMARRAARFHLTLGEITRSTDVSPETFLAYKNALLTHMSDFMGELDRYLPRLAQAVAEVEETGISILLNRAAESDERPLMRHDALLEDWSRRWGALRAWFTPDAGGAPPRTEQLRTVTRSGVSGVIALLRQITEAQRGGVNRSTELRHLAEWVYAVPDERAAHALMSTAFNLRSARHAGGAHDDDETISHRATWWDAPGVEVAVPYYRSGKPTTTGVPQRAVENTAVRAELRRRQLIEREKERAATRSLVAAGAHEGVLDAGQTEILLRLLTRALEARTVVAGRIVTGTGASDVAMLRLLPSETGSTVRTQAGDLHLPGVRLEITAIRPSAGSGDG